MQSKLIMSVMKLFFNNKKKPDDFSPVINYNNGV